MIFGIEEELEDDVFEPQAPTGPPPPIPEPETVKFGYQTQSHNEDHLWWLLHTFPATESNYHTQTFVEKQQFQLVLFCSAVFHWLHGVELHYYTQAKSAHPIVLSVAVLHFTS